VKRLVSLASVAGVVVVATAFALVGGSAAATTSSTLPTLTLTMNGKTIIAGGSEVSGAVTVKSIVTGEKLGDPLLFHVKPGASIAAGFAALAKHNNDPNYLDPYGLISFHVPAPKGVSSAQTRLLPGTYVAVDTEPTSGPPPFTVFSVTKSAHPAALPKPAATVSAIEFGFKGPGTLYKGTLVRFQNQGFLAHMIDWARVKNLKDASKAVTLLRAGKDNAAGKLVLASGEWASVFSSEQLTLGDGGLQQVKITQPKGVYLILCFMNTQDGREHTQLGMERIIHIK